MVRVDWDAATQSVVVGAEDVASFRRILTAVGVAERPRRWAGRGVRLDVHEASPLLGAPDVTLSIDARRALENRAHIRAVEGRVRRAVHHVLEGGIERAQNLLKHSHLLNKLDDHQVVNVAVMTVTDGWGTCVFDEQGTGKTVTMIAAFDTLVEQGKVDTLLVVAPKSMVAEWAEEVHRFTGDLYGVTVLDGTRQQKATALHDGADVYVTNYETVSSLQDDLRALCRRRAVVLAIDESFAVKNPQAIRTAAVTALREWCLRAYVLCGTPAPNSPVDIMAQFDLVDFGLTFRGLDRDARPNRTQVATAMRARGIYVRNLKQHVLRLPGKQFTIVRVPMSPMQRAAYEQALDQLTEDIAAVDDVSFAALRPSYLARRARLLRLCTDPGPVLADYDETPGKITVLDEVLVDQVERLGRKVVLWSFYRSSLNRLADRYAHYGLVRIDGSITDTASRREAVRAFQHDDKVRVFLGNPAAAGAGLTLHAAHVALYESVSNQAAHYLQSLDRIHRRGQERDVDYIFLVAEDTLEQLEYDRLAQKAANQASLLGDPPEEFSTRQLALDELLAAQAMLRGERR